jgi:hypothetical protein
MEVQAPLERIPLFVPAAGIIPQGKAMRYVGAMPTICGRRIFPHPRRGSGSFRLIEDDGLSLAYQRGENAEVGLEMVAEPEETCVRTRIRRAAYPLPYRQGPSAYRRAPEMREPHAPGALSPSAAYRGDLNAYPSAPASAESSLTTAGFGAILQRSSSWLFPR